MHKTNQKQCYLGASTIIHATVVSLETTPGGENSTSVKVSPRVILKGRSFRTPTLGLLLLGAFRAAVRRAAWIKLGTCSHVHVLLRKVVCQATGDHFDTLFRPKQQNLAEEMTAQRCHRAEASPVN